MATLTELNVVIGAQIDDFERNMAKVQEGIGRLGDAAKNAGQTLSTYVTLPLAVLGGAAIKAAGDMQALEKGFAATYKGAAPLSEALGKVQELAKLPGLGLQEALRGATNLQAAGFSADLATRALGAFGNALATVGRGKADLDGVGLALGQIASKGKISAEEINQLAERVPQIRQAMIAAFGTADTEVLQKMKISATDFVEGVTAELEKLPKVTGGINNAFENLQDAGTVALAKLGTALNKAFNIEGNIGKFADFLSGLAARFEALGPAAQKAIFVVAGLAAAAGPLLVVVGSIAASLPFLTAGLTLLAGPVGAIALAVAVAAGLIIENWDSIVSYFSEGGEGGRVFSDLAESVNNAVEAISSAFASLGGGGGDLGDMISAASILKDLLKDLTVGITALSDVVGGVVGGIVKLFKGDFAGALEEGKRALIGLIEPLANMFGIVVKGSTALKGSFRDAFQPIEEVTGLMGGDLAAALGKVTGLTAAQTEALEKIRKQLRDNENAARALGDNYDYVGGKVSILTNGVKKLTELGFAPGGQAVQQYARLLNELPTALDRALGGIGKVAAKLEVPLRVAQLQTPGLAGAPTDLKPLKIPPVDNRLFKKTLTDTEIIMEDFNKNGNKILGDGLAQIATTFFDGIGRLATGSITVEQFGGGLLSIIGQVCTQLGEAAIGIGVSMLAIKMSFSNPYTAIAAGAALIVLGAALGSIANSALEAGPSGGGGGGGSAPLASTPRTSLTTAPLGKDGAPTTYIHEVKFTLTGSQLTGALAIEQDRVGRVNGRR